jgi:hypothetical protein
VWYDVAFLGVMLGVGGEIIGNIFVGSMRHALDGENDFIGIAQRCASQKGPFLALLLHVAPSINIKEEIAYQPRHKT